MHKSYIGLSIEMVDVFLLFRSCPSAGLSLGCVLAPMVVAGVCGCALGHSAPTKGTCMAY